MGSVMRITVDTRGPASPCREKRNRKDHGSSPFGFWGSGLEKKIEIGTGKQHGSYPVRFGE